ncbi:MAG: hypothetical protein WCG15_00390 [Actinomycetes bacterium]
MTTKNTNTEMAVVNVNDAAQSIALQSQNDLDLSSFLDQSEGLDQLEEKIILTPSGISLDKVGESFSAIFMGFSTMMTKDQVTEELKEIPAVQFLINKQMRFNGGVTLVNQFKRINLTQGAKVRVTFVEKDKNTKIYSVSLLG